MSKYPLNLRYISFLAFSGPTTGGHLESYGDLDYMTTFNQTTSLTAYSPYSPTVQSLPYRFSSKIISTKSPLYRIPIFGARPYLRHQDLLHEDGFLIADSRNLFPLLQSKLAGKFVVFKSHGFLSRYFLDYSAACIDVFLKCPSLFLLTLSLRSFFLASIFLLVESLILCLSDRILIMRQKHSLSRTLSGKLFNKLFSYKTEYQATFHLRSYFLSHPISHKLWFNPSPDIRHQILIVGDWSLINNLSSLSDFLSRYKPESSPRILIVGKLSPYASTHLSRYLTQNVSCLGYVDDLYPHFAASTHILSVSSRGSGVPIKMLESIRQCSSASKSLILSSYSVYSIPFPVRLDCLSYPTQGSFSCFNPIQLSSIP